MLKYQKCENCGAGLVETKDGKYCCKYCKHLYTDQTLERAYEKASKSLRATVKEVVNEAFLNAKIEKVANCRQGLYNARTSDFINPQDVKYWSEQILKILPEDPQATFFLIASSKRWQDLNEFLKTFDAKTNAHLLDGFVDYLTNGQFVESCLLRLMDLIATTFNESTKVYQICHKKIAESSKIHNSGMFDETLPRDVFIAYSSKDKNKAYEIVEYLESHGLKCYISMRNLPKGVDAEQYYETRLKRAIDNCQVFLFVSSKNSRSRACDAYSVEMAYVKERDLKKSDNEYYYKNNYDLYFERYRKKCKARVEWLIDRYGDNIYEDEVKKFFKGLSWCVDKETVLSTVKSYVLNANSFEEALQSPYSNSVKPESHTQFNNAYNSYNQNQSNTYTQNNYTQNNYTQNNYTQNNYTQNNYYSSAQDRFDEYSDPWENEAQLRTEYVREKVEYARAKADFARAQAKKARIKADIAREKAKEKRQYQNNSFGAWHDEAREEDRERARIRFFLCLFFGIFGVHRYYDKKFFTGLLFTFTYGFFVIGWLIDIVRNFIKMIKD